MKELYYYGFFIKQSGKLSYKKSEAIYEKSQAVMKLFQVIFVLVLFSWAPVFTPVIQAQEWNPPQFSEKQSERTAFVNEYIKPAINAEQVIQAMESVPRHLFVPHQYRDNAYQDRPLPIGHGQTISQPSLVAMMTEMLKLNHNDKVLEIGTGSGYQVAILSHITPEVYSIEIIEPLGKKVRKRLEQLKYDAIQTKIADGYYGWEQHAPFDAIIVTAAAGHIPPPLIQQLKPGGVMVIPVGSQYETQKLMKVTKSESGKMRTESLMAVRFVPMTGAAQKQ